MEKARLDRIYRLLEIKERECHHELLLFVQNVQELGANPFPYIVLVLSHPLPSEIVKGKHFVLVDLLKSLPGCSSQAETASGPLVRQDHLPLAVQDPNPIPQARKKKKKKKTE